MYPNSVFMNRGNHECRAQNSWMGFEEEVYTKYGTEQHGIKAGASKVLAAFHACFDVLPLAAVIQERVFISHGGLFRMDGVLVRHLNQIKRKREPPMHSNNIADQLYEDILWSDPRPNSTYKKPLSGRRASERGAGIEFGVDVTKEFCARNSFALIIRSHECVHEGYEVFFLFLLLIYTRYDHN